jgi:radical SAM superfamily enzyme YgiQ (UPF0313 family)
MPKVLLVYPENPPTFWSANETLKLAGRKSAFPPLGLLTVAGLLPRDYELKLVDLNAAPLADDDIRWADVILTSSMIIHWPSLEEIIARANALGTPIVNGGPLPTQYHADIAGDAVFYLGEAENGFVDVIETAIRDGANGARPGRRVVDRRGQWKSLEETPVPRWDLINLDDYGTMMIQITRGCPESCTFCNIPALYGKTTRLRTASRTTRELDALYDAGWRGLVMVVDDNFVGNRTAIRAILENEVIPWQEERGHPFQLFTQASIRLTEDPALMAAMREAGFETIFVGIESPSADSLKFMAAQKNLQGDVSLVEKVRMLQGYGFQVQAGFIVGFDTDPADIADVTIDFIQEAAIPVAMVGILGVLPDTPDYTRYKRLGRLVEGVKYSGDSGLFSRQLSFVPNIDPEELFARHRRIVETVNRPDRFFARCLALLEHQTRPPRAGLKIAPWHIATLLRSLWHQGILSPYRGDYWRYLAAILRRHPRRFVYAFTMGVLAHHPITATQQALRAASFRTYCEDALARLERLVATRPADATAIRRQAAELLDTAHRRYAALKLDFRKQVATTLDSFRSGVARLAALEPSGRVPEQP